MKKNQIYFMMILSNKIYNMTNKRYVSYPKSIKQVWLTVKHNYLSKMININERRKWRKKHHVFHMFYPHKNCLTILNAIKSKKLSYSLTKLILNNSQNFYPPKNCHVIWEPKKRKIFYWKKRYSSKWVFCKY